MLESAFQTDRQTDRDRVKEVLAYGVPPKGLEARGTEGSMLGRRGWFDALSNGMVFDAK